MATKPLIDLSDDARQFLEQHKNLISYDIQETVLRDLVKKYPNHDNYEAVEVKAKLLNMFYSTGIQAIDAVVENIMSIIDIDKILNAPIYSKGLVDAIAELKLKDGKTRINYSFATKYCALHQPQKYPIYDSIVAEILTKLMITGQLPPYARKTNKSKLSTATYMTQGEFEEKLRDYDFFVKVYNTFMEDYGLIGNLNYRQVDWYLWGSYKDGGKPTKIEEITKLSTNKYVVYTPKNIKKTKKINS